MLFSRVSRVPRYRFYRLFSALQDLTSVVNGLAACAAQPEQFLSKLLSVSKEDFNRALVLLIQQRQYSRVIDIINALPEQHSYRNESTKLSSLIATAHSNDAAKVILCCCVISLCLSGSKDSEELCRWSFVCRSYY